MSKVFISYSKADQAFVDRVRKAFQSLGTNVVDPTMAVIAGDRWAERVTNELRQSDGLILVVPEAGSSGANNAFFEVGVARALGKPIFAVLSDKNSNRGKELPADLVDVAVLNASEAAFQPYAQAFLDRLQAA